MNGITWRAHGDGSLLTAHDAAGHEMGHTYHVGKVWAAHIKAGTGRSVGVFKQLDEAKAATVAAWRKHEARRAARAVMAEVNAVAAP
jgi:hypothetical protein